MGIVACGSSADSGTTDSASAEQDAALESPLLDSLGIDTAVLSGSSTAAQQAQQLATNEKIQSCMTAEGFEWQPGAESSMMFGGAEMFDGLDPESLEWAERFGFGVSTLAFPQEQVGPGLVGLNLGSVDEEAEDPNADYLAALSESDAAAYNKALYGDDSALSDMEEMTEEEIQSAQEEMMLNPSGCMAEAQNELFGGGLMKAFVEFGPDLQKLNEEIFEDPRIATLEQEVEVCVTDQGLEYVPQKDVFTHFGQKMAPLMGAGGFGGLTAGDAPELTDEEKTLLGEIQTEEVELAVAVHGCTEDDTYNETIESVRIEYEEKFVNDNQARIDAFNADE